MITAVNLEVQILLSFSHYESSCLGFTLTSFQCLLGFKLKVPAWIFQIKKYGFRYRA